MKYKLLTLSLLIFYFPTAWSWTAYNPAQSPTAVMDKGNSYTQHNLYSNNNNANGYSQFQSAYDPKSARNNTNEYGAPVNTYQGQFQGTITQPGKNASSNTTSITNPYGQQGNNFNGIHPSIPYTPNKWNNPYSTYQGVYDNQSVRNNSQYGVQYQDNAGNTIGTNNLPGNYHTDHTSNSYNGLSPFNNNSVQNPYGNNKKTY